MSSGRTEELLELPVLELLVGDDELDVPVVGPELVEVELVEVDVLDDVLEVGVAVLDVGVDVLEVLLADDAVELEDVGELDVADDVVASGSDELVAAVPESSEQPATATGRTNSPARASDRAVLRVIRSSVAGTLDRRR